MMSIFAIVTMADVFTTGAARSTLVTVCGGWAFEKNIPVFESRFKEWGFDHLFAWDQSTLEDAMATYTIAQAMNVSIGPKGDRMFTFSDQSYCEQRLKDGPRIRPYCAAFKPVALLAAMDASTEGDYVAWMDCSKIHSYKDITINVLEGIRGIEARGISSALLMGCAHDCLHHWCMTMNGEARLAPDTRRGFASLINATGLSRAAYDKAPMVLTSNMLFRVDAFNRGLLRAWRDMMHKDPRAFCCSHPQDQTAFSILALARKVPMVWSCSPTQLGENCHRQTKSASHFFQVLGQLPAHLTTTAVIQMPTKITCTE